MTRSTLSVAAILSVAAGMALADSHETAGAEATAQSADTAMEGMDHAAADMQEPNSAMLGYIAAMETSMNVMPSDSTGDADADFLMVMIPHHQSAVDMARIAVEVGDNPEVQALARAIMEDQEAEITAMQEMLAAMQVGGSSGEAVAPVADVIDSAETVDSEGAGADAAGAEGQPASE